MLKPQDRKKKLWKKQKFSIRTVGKCRYCNKEVTNDMSFLCYADKSCSHYQCEKKDYYKKIIKQDHNNRLGLV